MTWKEEYNFTLLDIDREVTEIHKKGTNRYSKEMFGEDKWIPLDKIKVDHSVQRDIQETHVQTILKKFDPTAFGRLVVTLREDGFYYVTDGQHRAKVLEILGFSEAPCVVVNLYNHKDEGLNFININEQSAKVSNIDKYRIGCSSMLEPWLRVRECVEYIGASVGAGKNQVSCVSSIYKLVNSSKVGTSRERDISLVKKSLFVIDSVWGIEGISHTMLNAMYIFLKNHTFLNYDTTTNEVVERLKARKITYKEIISRAGSMRENQSSRGKVSSYMAYLLYAEYNNGVKKNRLPLRIIID